MNAQQGKGVFVLAVIVAAVAFAVVFALKTMHRIFFVERGNLVPGSSVSAAPIQPGAAPISTAAAPISTAAAPGSDTATDPGLSILGPGPGNWDPGRFVERRGRWIRRERFIGFESGGRRWPARVQSTAGLYMMGEPCPFGLVVAVWRRSWGAEVLITDGTYSGSIYVEREYLPGPASVVPVAAESDRPPVVQVADARPYEPAGPRDGESKAAPSISQGAAMRGARF